MHDDSAWDTWVCDIYKIYRLQDRARTGGKYHARQREKVKKSVRSSPRSLWCCARGRILCLSAPHNISLSPCAHRQHSLAYVRAQIDRTVTPSSCAGAITSTALAHTHTHQRSGEEPEIGLINVCLRAALTIKYMGKKWDGVNCIYLSLSTRLCIHIYTLGAWCYALGVAGGAFGRRPKAQCDNQPDWKSSLRPCECFCSARDKVCC